MQPYIAHGSLPQAGAHGQQLLQQLFLQVTGQPLPPIVREKNGKPVFLHSPWHFSVTHTGDRVFCALARCPVGIDAETLGRSVPEGLARRVLSDPEYAQYAEAEDRARAFLHFWVLKEAAAKCSGRGIQYPENTTNFSLADSRVTETQGCLLAVITEEDHVI